MSPKTMCPQPEALLQSGGRFKRWNLVEES
jgi:hypothetical protein